MRNIIMNHHLGTYGSISKIGSSTVASHLALTQLLQRWRTMSLNPGPAMFETLPDHVQIEILTHLDQRSFLRAGMLDRHVAELTRPSLRDAIPEICVVCGRHTRYRCEACRSAFYCCEGHQRFHSAFHRVTCDIYRARRQPLVWPTRRSWASEQGC